MRNNWTREELIVAFNLYCKIPFGKIYHRNSQIIALAEALGRTPSALSWKLANFARLDPTLRDRQIRGATHGSKLEEQVWKEFNEDWDGLANESEMLINTILLKEQDPEPQVTHPVGTSRIAQVNVRVNQSFFRSAVMAAYDSRCCITGISIPELLNASHIIPWSIDANNRTNPRNGLCLNAIHDRAFDRGMITITPHYDVQVSPQILSSSNHALRLFVSQYHGSKITLPAHFVPDPSFLEYHNQTIFQWK